MTDLHFSARLRAAATTFTQDRTLKREAADHLDRLEALLLTGLGRKRSPDYEALVKRALEV